MATLALSHPDQQSLVSIHRRGFYLRTTFSIGFVTPLLVCKEVIAEGETFGVAVYAVK